jgi:hypothetical protein
MDIERKVLTAPLEAVKADPTQIEQVLMDRRRIFRALSRMDSSGRDHAEIRRRGDGAETHDQLHLRSEASGTALSRGADTGHWNQESRTALSDF